MTIANQSLLYQLLDLRLCQENGEDTRDIEQSIQDIWRNACLVWDLRGTGEQEALSERWTGIAARRSSRKKQVKHDARLVLATRLCLEQGIRRGSPSPSPSSRHRASPLHSPSHAVPVAPKISPQRAMRAAHAVEIWTAAVLAEMFGVSALCGAVMTHMHSLLCPDDCSELHRQQRPLSSVRLAAELRVESLMEDDRECQQLAQRLYIHFHKFHIPVEHSLQGEESPPGTARTTHRLAADSAAKTPLVPSRHMASPASARRSPSPRGPHVNGAALSRHHSSPSRPTRHSPSSSPSSDSSGSGSSARYTSSLSDTRTTPARRSIPSPRHKAEGSIGLTPQKIDSHAVKSHHSGRTQHSLGKGNQPDVSLDTVPSLSHYSPPSPHPYSPHETSVPYTDAPSPTLPVTRPLIAHADDKKLSLSDLKAQRPDPCPTPKRGAARRSVSRGSSTGGSASGSDRSERKARARKSQSSMRRTRREKYDSNGHRICKHSTHSRSVDSPHWRGEKRTHKQRLPLQTSSYTTGQESRSRSRSSSRGYHSAGSLDADKHTGRGAHAQSVAFGRRETNSKREPRHSREMFADAALASSALHALQVEANKDKHFDPEEG